MSERFVLDAWALLALLQAEEPAALRVKDLLSQAQSQQVEVFMSIINLGEVVYRVGRVQGPTEAEKALEMLRQLPLEVLPATDETVLAAASIKMVHAISYADAFAVVAAGQHHGVLVTGDLELLLLKDIVRLERLQRHVS